MKKDKEELSNPFANDGENTFVNNQKKEKKITNNNMGSSQVSEDAFSHFNDHISKDSSVIATETQPVEQPVVQQVAQPVAKITSVPTPQPMENVNVPKEEQPKVFFNQASPKEDSSPKMKKLFSTTGSKVRVVAMIIALLFLAYGVYYRTHPDMLKKKEENQIKKLDGASEYQGDGFKLKCDYYWSKGKLSNLEVLYYTDGESYLMPVGVSGLNETIKCNFDTANCKRVLYEDFFNYLSPIMNKSNLQIYMIGDSFEPFKNDRYIAVYDYGIEKTDLKGKYYLVVDQSKNAVLSFMSNSKNGNLKNLHESIMDLFETMEIDEIPLEGEKDSKTGDATTEIDSSISYWRSFKQVRIGAAGKNKEVEGEWRVLSDEETYWVFRDGKFWWYKSVNDLGDNYWSGDYSEVVGKEGAMAAGLTEEEIDKAIADSDGTITESDFHTLLLVPTKYYTEGKDATDQIEGGTKWLYVWIFVDHDDEGLEGQIVSINSQAYAYYVKMKD